MSKWVFSTKIPQILSLCP